MCVLVAKKYTEEVFLPHFFCPIPVGSNINNPPSTFSPARNRGGRNNKIVGLCHPPIPIHPRGVKKSVSSPPIKFMEA